MAQSIKKNCGVSKDEETCPKGATVGHGGATAVRQRKVATNPTLQKNLKRKGNFKSDDGSQKKLKKTAGKNGGSDTISPQEAESIQVAQEKLKKKTVKTTSNVIVIDRAKRPREEPQVVDLTKRADGEDAETDGEDTEAEAEDPVDVHQEITAKILFTRSAMVNIKLEGIAAPNFTIHEDLITIHISYLTRTMVNIGKSSQTLRELTLPPWVNYKDFAILVSWMYTGTLSLAKTTSPSSRYTHCHLANLWMLGHNLTIPAFQNTVMDHVKKLCAENQTGDVNCAWPSLLQAEEIYQRTNVGTKLRAFTSAALAFKRPVEKMEEGSEEWRKYFNMWMRTPALFADLVKANLGAGCPWDDHSSKLWMVVDEDLSLKEKWEDLAKGRKLMKVRVKGWAKETLREMTMVL